MTTVVRTLGLLVAVLCAAVLVAETSRPRRPPLGGWRPMDVNSTDAQEAARKATVHLEQASNSMRAYRLHQLVSAKYQIVAGKNYQLVLKIAQTDCNRGQNVNLENCQTVKVQKCSVTIHVPLQSQSSELTSQSCRKEKAVGNKQRPTKKPSRRPPMPGGATEIDVSREEVREAATFATQQLTSQSNGGYRVEQQRIKSATSQIVAGVMYTITMDVSLTQSGNSETKSTQCVVKVWDQAWRTPRYMLQEYKCNEFIA